MNTGLLRRAAIFFAVAVLGALLPATTVAAQDPDPGSPPPARQELVGRRTQTSKTYLNPDGTLTTTFFSGPVHYEDGRGNWKDIEDELVAAESGPYAVRNGKNAFDVAFKQDVEEGYLRFRVGRSAFDFTLEGAARAAGASRGRGVSYDEVMPGVDLDYELLPEGLKETLILRGPNVPTRYRFVMEPVSDVPAQVVKGPDGTWQVYTEGAAPAFTFSAPSVMEAPEPDEPEPTPTPSPSPEPSPTGGVASPQPQPSPEPTAAPDAGQAFPSPGEPSPEGAARSVASTPPEGPTTALESPEPGAAPEKPAGNGEPRDPARGTSAKESQANVALDVRSLGNGRFAVELSVDPQWLHDPEREFPILLDPTITVPTTAEDASYAWLCGGCTGHADKNLYLGTGNQDVWRDALKFDVSQMPTDQIISAELQLWHDGSCLWNTVTCSNTSRDLQLYRMTAPWFLSTTVSQLQYDPAILGTFSLPAGAQNLPLTWNVTQTVKDWIRGVTPAHGFLVKQEQEVLGSGGAILPYGRRHAQIHRRPLLQVNYTDVPVILDPIDTIHSNGAELSWTPYSSVTGEAFQKYEVHRSQDRSFTPNDGTTLLRTITSRDETSFVDTTAAPNKSFTYRIVANDTFTSNARSVMTPADGQGLKYVQEEPYELSQDTTIVYNKDYEYCYSHGRDNTLTVGAMSWKRQRSLLRFDLDGIPRGATIHQAKLGVLQRQDSLPWDRAVTVEVHRATRGWVQGTWSTGWCNGKGATWYTIDGTNPWSNQGADFDPAVEATATVPPNGLAELSSFNIAPLVSKWVSGETPNFGIVLKAADETMADWNQVGYYSTDSNVAGLDQGQRPTLEVRYQDGSHSVGPSAALTKPLAGARLTGTSEMLAATVTDDGRVDLVEFLVDGAVVGTDNQAPYSATWNSTTVPNGSKTFTVRARDEVGNVTTSAAVQAEVENSAPPTVSLVAPVSGAVVTGTVPVLATASDDGSVTKVEFLVDGLTLGSDATAPYETSWDTLNPALPAYNGSHQLSAVAYDNHGQTTTSTVSVTVANAAGTKYIGSLTSTSMPQEIVYEPPTCGTGGNSACPQQAAAINVSYRNNSTQKWLASDVVLKYQWLTPTGTVVATGPETALRGDALPGAKVPPVRVNVDPPVLDPGIDRAQLVLRIDLFEKSTGTWFTAKGNKPLEAPVIVHKLKATDMLGLERYYQYTGMPVGAGMGHLVNLASGNSLLRWTPFSSPGTGLSTVLDLTYNTLEDKSESPAGNNVSLSLSSLTRFGNPLDIHPNNADAIAGNSNRMIRFTDGDGTTHEFVGKQAADGTVYWEEPQGVHLWLRTYSTTNAARKWALTRPDGVTFFYNADGYPTSVEDRNGNKLVFALEAVPPGEDPGGFKYRITSVTDAAGAAGAPNRSFNVDYYSKDEAKKPQVRGKIEKITDHNGSALVFSYYDDGNLLRLTQKGGLKADGTPLADRSFVFTYTSSAGNGPAIADTAARVNPDPKTSPQSTRLYSVRDPRGAETTFTYLGSGTGLDRWKLASVTDRAGKTTTIAYGTDRTTTVTAPMSRVTKYTFDGEGKVTTILDPKSQTTSVQWSPERHVTRVEEPGGGVTRFAYNANGYLTDRWDQLNRHTMLEYDNLAVKGEGGAADARDAAAYWKAGRSIQHMSELARVVDPRGNDVEFDTDARGNVILARDQEEFETRFAYDPANGNLLSVTDARNNVSRFLDYDANGLPQALEDAEGNTTRMTYDDDGLLRSVQLPRNSGASRSRYTALEFEYDAFHRLGRQSEPKSETEIIWSGVDYDPNDNVVLARSPKDTFPELLTAPGHKTTFSYDAMDRLLVSDGPDEKQRVGYSYDDAGRLLTAASPKGMDTAVVDDFATTFAYDALDRVVKTTRWTSGGSTVNAKGTRYEHFCYDAAGDLVARVAPNAGKQTLDCALAIAGGISFTTRFTYDAAHQLKVVRQPDGSEREMAYDLNGNTTTLVDERDKTTQFFYDRRNMVFKVERPFNATRNVTSRTFYDGVGNIVKQVSPRAFDLSDGTTFTHYVTEYIYDKANRLTRVDLPQAPSEIDRAFVHRSYDADGNVDVTTLPSAHNTLAGVPDELRTTIGHLSNGWVESVDDHVNPATFYDYAPEGWQTSRSLETGKQETWDYFPDGTLHTHFDRDGQDVTYGYDLNDNVVQINEHAGKVHAGKRGIEMTMTYDSFDQLTQVKRHVKQREEIADEATATFTTYAYDAHGNVLTRVDDGVKGADQVIRGRTHKFAYDAVDRLLTHWDAGDGSGCGDDQLVTNSYLATGWQDTRRISKTNGTCPTSPADMAWQPKQKTSWQYFDNGDLQQLTTLNEVNGANEVLERHTVDYTDLVGGKSVYFNGHRVKDDFMLRGPGTECAVGCVTRFEYDARDKLVRHVRPWATDISFDLDFAGNVETESSGNTTKTFVYRGTRLEESVVTVNGVAAPPLEYRYNPEGTLNCVVKKDWNEDGCPGGGSPLLVTDYDYDYLDRIQKIAEYGGDATPRATTEYDHDVLDRLDLETEKRGTRTKVTKFTYVGLTDRVAKEEIDNTDTSNPSISDVTKTYSYDAFGTRVSMTNSPTAPGSDEGGPAGTFTYGYDVHGSVSQLIRSDGTVQATYGYTPYGGADDKLTKGELQGPMNQLNPYRYSGRRLDTGSGTIDMGARRFSPDTGRFLQPDVFQGALANLGLSMDPLSGNRYALAAGNPVSFIEVDGHYPADVGPANDPPDGPPGRDNRLADVGPAAGSVDPAVWGDWLQEGEAIAGGRLSPQCYNKPETVGMARPLVGQCFEHIGMTLTRVNQRFVEATGVPYNPGWEPMSDLEKTITTEVGSSFIPVVRGAKVVGAVLKRIPGVKRVAAWVTSKTVRASADDLPVIGKLDDTAAYKNQPGYQTLDVPNWRYSQNVNDAWVQSIIDQRLPVYVTSPRTADNLNDVTTGVETMFGREIRQLKEAGYEELGDYLMPPI